MSHHMTKYEPDGSVTTWESPDGKCWRMTSQTYPKPPPPPPPGTYALEDSLAAARAMAEARAKYPCHGGGLYGRFLHRLARLRGKA